MVKNVQQIDTIVLNLKKKTVCNQYNINRDKGNCQRCTGGFHNSIIHFNFFFKA